MDQMLWEMKHKETAGLSGEQTIQHQSWLTEQYVLVDFLLKWLQDPFVDQTNDVRSAIDALRQIRAMK